MSARAAVSVTVVVTVILAACGHGAGEAGSVLSFRTLGRVGALSPELTAVRTAENFHVFLERERTRWSNDTPDFQESLVVFVPSEGSLSCMPEVESLLVTGPTTILITLSGCGSEDGLASDVGVGTTWVLSVECGALPSPRGEFSVTAVGGSQTAAWDCS
jgi:hypothetical protein